MADSDYVVHVTDETFDEEVTKSNVPVLVDFWAPWCGPCLALGPTIEELAESYKGKIKVAKVNVDESAATAGDLGIRSIPTLILFDKGDTAETVVGLVSKERIEEMIKKVVEQ